MTEDLLRFCARSDFGDLRASFRKQGDRDFVFGADIQSGDIHRSHQLFDAFRRDERLELHAQLGLIALHRFDLAGTLAAYRKTILPRCLGACDALIVVFCAAFKDHRLEC